MHPDPIFSSIHDLLPTIRARRTEIEDARQLPADLAEALCATNVFSLSIPRAIGGQEASPLDLLRVIETVSAADGSTGWCTMVGLGNNMAAGYMPESGAREVFADPTAPTAGIAAPSGKAVRAGDGVRVSGRWPFASGITHARWAWAGCLVMQNGKPNMTPHGPEILHVCMPVQDLEVHDTWHVSGLCGSGSNDFSADDVFVPEHRTFRLLDPAGHRGEPLYQMPPLPLFVYQVACVSLGIARAALDELSDLAQVKVPTLYSDVLADKAAAHIGVARAEVALGSARALLHEIVEEIWDAVRAGDMPSTRQVALGRAASTHAAETGAAVAERAGRLAGGGTIYRSSPLQRHARDAAAAAHHFTMAPHTWEEAGRLLMGRETIAPVF